jgi:predicted nucleic acid-binding protein
MFVDTNVFAYAAIDSTAVGDRARKKFLTLKGTTSPLVIDEFLWILRGKHAHLREPFINDIQQNTNIRFLAIHPSACFEAFALIRKHNLKPRDALHVAVMLANNETEILSNDPDFDRVPGLKRISF